ncbi:YncE family protein [Nocardia wallacei]|uniref:YncE family protein n=1 Tax=Nocardia wallacei TaxID=480035 RepID=UPI002458530B|nr:YncE family protein [Nocardia wallacei]
MKRTQVAAMVSAVAALSSCATPSLNADESTPSAVRITGGPIPLKTSPVSVTAGPMGMPFSATIPVELAPTELALVPGSSALFASTSSGDTIAAVDTGTKSMRARYLAEHKDEHIAINAKGDRIYVATGAVDHSVLVVDTTAGGVVSRVVGRADQSEIPDQSLTIDRRTGTLYMASNSWSCFIMKIDTATDSVVSKIPIADYGYDLALDEEGNTIYVGTSTAVLAIDTKTGLTTATVHLGTQANDVEIETRTQTLYAANRSISSISVIDLKTHQVVTTIALQYQPSHIALDHAAKLAYVTANNFDSARGLVAEIYVIDTDTNKIIDTYRITNAQLAGVVVDTESHTAYIAVPTHGVIALLDRARN